MSTPNITRADEIMAHVSEVTGQQWLAVKLSGMWVVYRPEDSSERATGYAFSKAVEKATGVDVGAML